MSFHEVRFPESLSLGSGGGPERRTEIVTLASGHEERNGLWSQSRRRYDAGLGMRSMDDIAALIAFFEARGGRLHGFRWKDWSDFRSGLPSAAPTASDQVIGTGDGVTAAFGLVKRYVSGAQSHDRAIVKPVAGSVRIAVAGVELAEGEGWTLDTATGRVSFGTPPPDGAQVTAGFEFDVPVRFDTDSLDVSVSGFAAGEVPSVPVVEIRA